LEPDSSIAGGAHDGAQQSCHSLVVKTLSQVHSRTPRGRMGRAVRSAAVLAVTLIAGCMYRTGFNEYPGVRSLTWYSYAGGQDIRTGCAPGHDIYRVIYNGNWQEQVRTYDLGPSATGSGGVMDERIFAGGAGFTLATTLTLPLNDPLEPTRSVDAQTRLSEADYRALLAALTADGLGQPGPADARLGSWQFWWASAACINGSFFYNAWIYPTPRFAALRFPALLLRHDQTGVPVNAPRRTEQQAFTRAESGREAIHSDFTIQLDGNGLPISLPSF
jgi:hypothetical protein